LIKRFIELMALKVENPSKASGVGPLGWVPLQQMASWWEGESDHMADRKPERDWGRDNNDFPLGPVS
jgi:hypothetical protein